MKIIKRNGQAEIFQSNKISEAMAKAFESVETDYLPEEIEKLTSLVEDKIELEAPPVSVETIQDFVEQTLMEQGYYKVSKSYIIYRSYRSKQRDIRIELMKELDSWDGLEEVLMAIQKNFRDERYALEFLRNKYVSFGKPDMSQKEKLNMLIKSAAEMTTQDAPLWEYIAGRLLYYQFEQKLRITLAKENISSFAEKVQWLEKEGLYGKYILENYTREELNVASEFIVEENNQLLNFSGLDLLLDRYVIRSFSGEILESPQEMYLGIALHLAMLEEKNRMDWVEKFYNMLSSLKVTMATPTLSNARKPFHQLSSCFIDTVPDSLTGIYRSIDNFAQVSKFGGGMGMYFGKIRASGSTIRGFKGAAGGVVRWIKLANDTAVAVDQLGVRQGAVAVYLDVWHKDLPEFLELRTNSGDDRMKAHDVFPALCYPDLFWQTARDNLEDNWYLMCPHEIKQVKGYALEDFWGKEWEKRYMECVDDPKIDKRVIPIKDLVRLIIKSSVETGTPFAFNRDAVNRANPNSHNGVIYSSNLCTEIAQNMSGIEEVSKEILTENGEEVVVTTTKPGDFVVCNLASLSLGNIDIHHENELETLTTYAIRALDNVIDLNFFPIPYAKITNNKYRPLGLGVSGYHHMLAREGIPWEKEEHFTFVDDVFQRINFAAISASSDTAGEKGSYEYFVGSDWETGEYFRKREYTSPQWLKLKEKVKTQGLRNGYLLAIAPTSSTSILAGTTAGIDPIMNRFFLEEKKTGLMPRVAPDLNKDTFWLYKDAHLMDQRWSIRAAGIRQRHIDQAQSMNLYITTDMSFRDILNLYILAYEQNVKSIYYIRSKSLEVEDCEVCSS